MPDELKSLKQKTVELFYSRTPRSLRFNRFLLGINVAAIFLFFLDPLTGGGLLVQWVEIGFGLLFLVEYLLRLWIAGNRAKFAASLLSIVDLIVILSLFAPLMVGDFGFLRVVRALRILRAYRALADLSGDERSWPKRHGEVIGAVVNLAVFIFIMTDIVYVLQVESNPRIDSYIDALYFTITTLTTTGFGDITPEGNTGKLLAILIMVFGVALFVRLAQSVFRPEKAIYECPDCGLSRHDPDAIHCKHCGRTIRIRTEGA
jgi:voltage-gated potassium channel